MLDVIDVGMSLMLDVIDVRMSLMLGCRSCSKGT